MLIQLSLDSGSADVLLPGADSLGTTDETKEGPTGRAGPENLPTSPPPLTHCYCRLFSWSRRLELRGARDQISKDLTESVIGLDFEKLRPSWRVRNWDGVEKSETEETELAEGQISQDDVVDGGGGALRGNPGGPCCCPCTLPCRYKRSFSGLSFWPMMKIRQENEHNNRSVLAWGRNGS